MGIGQLLYPKHLTWRMSLNSLSWIDSHDALINSTSSVCLAYLSLSVWLSVSQSAGSGMDWPVLKNQEVCAGGGCGDGGWVINPWGEEQTDRPTHQDRRDQFQEQELFTGSLGLSEWREGLHVIRSTVGPPCAPFPFFSFPFPPSSSPSHAILSQC